MRVMIAILLLLVLWMALNRPSEERLYSINELIGPPVEEAINPFQPFWEI